MCLGTGCDGMAQKLLIGVIGLALCASTALAKPPRGKHLPLDGAKLVTHLRKAVKAKNAKEVERTIRVMVYLGKRTKKVVKAELAKDNNPILPHLLEALSRMAPRMRMLARPLLKAKNPQIRKLAAMAIDGANTSLLVAALQKESDEDVQFALITSIAGAEDAAATAVLVNKLNSKKATIRAQSLHGLMLRKDPRALPEVHGALRDPSAEVRNAAIEALTALAHPSSVAPLLDLATLEDDRDNLEAIWLALREITGQDFGKDLKAWKRWLRSGA